MFGKMFKNKYKENALKWQEYTEQKEIAKADKEYELTYEVYLVGGSSPLTVTKRVTGWRSWDHWNNCHYHTITGRQLLENFIEGFPEHTKNGITLDGSFYPIHKISYVEFGEISAVGG